MPNGQQQTTPQSPDTPYTAIDPQKNFLGFVTQNKEAIAKMPEAAQFKFVDMVFRRFALPKYQQINKQRPLDEDEIAGLRAQFAARLLGIPLDRQTDLKDEKTPEAGVLKKVAAALEGGGAGVLGGIKSIDELIDRFQKHVPIAGDYLHMQMQQDMSLIGKIEGKAFEDASAISPGIASGSAAVGHQIPAMIATEGAGMFPKLASKGASIGLKALEGAARGGAEGAVYGATAPGQTASSGAGWGAVLGAAFPLVGKLFGFGRGTTTKAAEAVAGAGEKTESATAAAVPGEEKAATSLGDVANKVAKEKFGKSFKDLSPTEKTQMPNFMKEEIKKQAAIKSANAKAAKAAAKAGREADETAKRAEKAKAATEKANAQAAKRSQTGATTPIEKQAVAAKAAEENPAVAKIMQSERRVTKGTPPSGVAERRAAEVKEVQKANLAHLEDELKTVTDPVRKKSIQESIEAVKDLMKTKVPEGAEGKKIRAKGGEPASPAQQAADRERIAKKREAAKTEEFGAALEKHAQEMAGRHTSASLGIMHVPELEGAVKEMPNGEYMLKTLQKAKRAYKWSDEIYAESLKEWLLNQFKSGSSKTVLGNVSADDVKSAISTRFPGKDIETIYKTLERKHGANYESMLKHLDSLKPSSGGSN